MTASRRSIVINAALLAAGLATGYAASRHKAESPLPGVQVGETCTIYAPNGNVADDGTRGYSCRRYRVVRVGIATEQPFRDDVTTVLFDGDVSRKVGMVSLDEPAARP